MEPKKPEYHSISEDPEWGKTILACLRSIQALLAEETPWSKEKAETIQILAAVALALEIPK